MTDRFVSVYIRNVLNLGKIIWGEDSRTEHLSTLKKSGISVCIFSHMTSLFWNTLRAACFHILMLLVGSMLDFSFYFLLLLFFLLLFRLLSFVLSPSLLPARCLLHPPLLLFLLILLSVLVLPLLLCFSSFCTLSPSLVPPPLILFPLSYSVSSPAPVFPVSEFTLLYTVGRTPWAKWGQSKATSCVHDKWDSNPR